MTTPVDREKSSEERKGFTLVEMMVVVAIIGILAGIAFVSMMHYRMVIRVNATARDLAGQMRIARASAVKEGKSVLVNFNQYLGTQNYQVGLDSAEDGTFDGFFHTYYLQPGIRFGYFPTISAVPSHEYPVTHPVEIKAGAGLYINKFHFRQDGTASYNGVAYLIPSNDLSATGNRDDRCRAVDWEATTGRIRVWKWKFDDHTWR